MVNFGTPYAMDGTVIPGATLRRQLQSETGDVSGVCQPGDLKITPMDVPGAGVKISAGDDIILCREPGRERESYRVPLYTSQNYLGDGGTGIPGTGSEVPPGGRRDMIIHEILDPELATHYTPMELWPEDASSKLSIVQDVGATARTVDDVPELANVTCYELAAVTYPASTSTVNLAMIEDLRQLQTPRSERKFRTVDLDAVQYLDTVAAYPGGQNFPNEFSGDDRRLLIPKWATHARLMMIWGSVKLPAATTATGTFWIQIGANAHPDVVRTAWGAFDGSNVRDTWVKADEVKIPKSMRGTVQSFLPRARLDVAVATDKQPFLTSSSSLVLDVEFFRTAV